MGASLSDRTISLMRAFLAVCLALAAFAAAAPFSEVVPEDSPMGLVQELVEGAPQGNPMAGMMGGIACKLRKAVHLADSNAKGKKVLADMKQTSAWKAHAAPLNALMDCVKGNSPIATCDAKMAPLMGFMMELLAPMQTMMAKMEQAVPHFKSKVKNAKC